MGTWHSLVNEIGLIPALAKVIEANYHDLYKVADEWRDARLAEASSNGFVTVAFGLRVRTPILKQTILNTSSTPIAAAAESRTTGNALGQSYGLLNNRAGIEFQERVLKSEYAEQIKPIMQIHDAMYFLVLNQINVVRWFNDNLPECMAWQKLPELEHDTVKLSGGVEIFYPNWNVKTALPNKATNKEIMKICLDSAKNQTPS